MRTIGTIVALRWALTWAALRKSVWQTIGYVISLLVGVGVVVGTGALAWFLGGSADLLAIPGYGPGLQTVVVIVGAFLTLGVALVQLMLIGEGATMSPRKFELYGIPDRELHAGLLVSGLSGLPAICGLLSLLLWPLAYRWMGAGAVAVALVAAPLAIVTMVSVSKMVISAATTLVRSTRGRNAFYCVVLVAFVVMCQVPSVAINTQDVEVLTIEPFAATASVLAWTPFGAAFRLPFDAYAGDWAMLAGRVAVLAVTWALCFLISVWCLRRERLTVGSETATASVKGVGAFAWAPDSVSGAVSARVFTYLRRDPRQGLMFIFPLLFVVLFAIQSHGMSVMVWQGLLWGGLFVALAEANGLAYDGRGWTMQAICGVRGMDDRIGRARVYATLITLYTLVLAVACFVITGDWASPGGVATGLTYAALSLGLSYCSLGAAEVTSCVLMYPVPSIDKPFSTPQGRAVAQMLFPFVPILGTVVLMLPTALVGVGLLLAGLWDLYWVLIPVALADGVGFLVLGSWLGGKLMDARMPAIVRTLDSFASLQK